MKPEASGDETQRTYKYEAFISYRHLEPDASIAIALHQALEHFTIPPLLRNEHGDKKIGRIFRDQEELPTSSNLGRDIEEALHDSKWLILICTPRLLESKWCMREVDSFIEQGRRDSILTLLVEGEPSDSFPPQIRFADIDGETVEIEPLAADVRAQTLREMKKRLKREKLRLLAPMLDVTFDALYQRAKKHARKMAGIVLSGIAAALLVFGGIVGYQAMKTAQANKFAALEKIAKLIATSESYITDGQQNPAVNAACEAFELARQHGIYELETEAALYRAIVQFPKDGSFAKLQHSADILQTVFSPDGSHIALLTRDHRITVWDTKYAVKRCEIDLAPDLFSLDQALLGVGQVEENWCSFCFNSDNELYIMDLSSLKLGKYSVDGTLLHETTDDFGRGYNLKVFAAHSDYVLYRPEMHYLRGADAIVLSSYVSESPDAPSFDAALFAFDAQTGEKIYEHRFEPASLYPVWTDVAGDGESMAFYYLYDENGENCTQVILINEDVLRNGVRFAAYDFSQVTFQYMAQLHDSAFLIATKENEIAVLDAKTMKFYPVPEVAPPQEEDDGLLILTGQKRGEFFAGFRTSKVNCYSFDGKAVTFVRTVIDVDEHTFNGTWIERFGWANKDEGTVAYVSDKIGKTGTRFIKGEQLFYQDYQYDTLDDYLYSDYGIYAETEGNLCVLYDFNTSDTEFKREALYPRYQPGFTHVDVEQELIVAQNSDENGFYFEISTFDEARSTTLHKVYLPNTKGYDAREDWAPYDDIYYTKDYAIIVTHPPGKVTDEEGEGTAILYTLHYQSGTLRASAPWERLFYNRVSGFNDKGVVITTHSTILMFDPADPTNVTKIDRQSLFQEEWLEDNIPFGHAIGLAPKNIVIWPFTDKTDNQLKLAYLDLDTQQYVVSDTVYRNNINYPVLWSDSGKIFFALDGTTNFNAYNVETMAMLNREDFPADIMKMQKIGGNIIALYSSKNAVEFYDMDSCKKLFAIEPSVEAPQHVSYNETNGLAVVSRAAGFEIIDIRSGSHFYGPVSSSKHKQSDWIRELYITNDKRALLQCLHSNRQSDSGISLNWYNYFWENLLDGEMLLEVAQKFK